MYCPSSLDEGLFVIGDLQMKKSGFYVIKDKFFEDMEDPYLRGNKSGNIHIVKLPNDRETTFLIQDMFPITEEYIEREYRIAGNHMVLASERVIKDVDQKARKVVAMLKSGVKFTPTQPDVIKMLNKLNS